MNKNEINVCANRLIANSVIEERLSIPLTTANIIALANCISDLERQQEEARC